MLEVESESWLLGERETVCIHNCAKAYIELKGNIHNQLLKDYAHVRKNNRKLFENIWLVIWINLMDQISLEEQQ